ncbi:hypothetical protein C3F09_00960 [candidate division GN15 bacterium]|uniref:Glycosyltransferase 2-like domain-containing protein n=1 Tax=candidate division GN15 bacterium TaxID=2072418 RepID=A0A855X6A6_9BACT|nr:MAG: hypothetical protein C3F09_00960 [candidate division GN15 bacterium]
MSQIEIVIVNWNTLELTRRCLESLLADLRQTDLEYKIWVVDNSSTDGSPAMIRAEFPQVNLVENRENVGFARANNQVLRTATAPLVLLLNSDTVTHQGAIKSMVDQISGRPGIAAVGPKLIYPNGAVQRSFTRLPSVIGELKYCLAFHFFPFNSVFYTLFGFGTRAWERSTALREVEVLSAACVLIRKEVFDRVGLLAEDYFLFSEENDLFCRMKRAGFRSVYLPEAVVTHVVGASRRKRGGVDSQVNFLKSRMIFFRRYHASSYFLVRAIYRLFLAWSIFMARLVKTLKRSSNSDYVTMYSRLLETLAETRAS